MRSSASSLESPARSTFPAIVPVLRASHWPSISFLIVTGNFKLREATMRDPRSPLKNPGSAMALEYLPTLLSTGRQQDGKAGRFRVGLRADPHARFECDGG